MARAFLERIGIKSAIVEQVVPIVEHHLASSSVGRDPLPEPSAAGHALGSGQHRSASPCGRGRSFRPSSFASRIARRRYPYSGHAVVQAVEHEPQAPLILGRHVLPYFENRPGKHIGEVTRLRWKPRPMARFRHRKRRFNGWNAT